MPAEIDPKKLSIEGLDALIENHRKRGQLSAPLYLAALGEWERRKSGGLDFDKSMMIIRRAAANRQFLSYKDIADESGAKWSAIYNHVGSHLTRLCEYAYRQGWPLLSAIVVNKDNLDSGSLKERSLDGFVEVARGLGYVVTDKEAFLKEQQERVFTWAAARKEQSELSTLV
jgi:5-methylcytosine-specific restriction protein B